MDMYDNRYFAQRKLVHIYNFTVIDFKHSINNSYRYRYNVILYYILGILSNELTLLSLLIIARQPFQFDSRLINI